MFDSDVGLVNRLVGKIIKNPKVMEFLASAPMETLNEGLEEVVSDILNPVAEWAITGNRPEYELDQIIEDGVVGVLTALIAKGGAKGINRVSNAVSGLADNATVDKLLNDRDTIRFLTKKGGLKLTKDMTQAQKRAEMKRAISNVARGQKTASTGEAESTAIEVDAEGHTPAQQRIIKEYQNNVNDNLWALFDGYLKNPKQGFSRYNISEVTQRQARDVERLLGGEYDGYTNAINSNGVLHILKEHGPEGTTDHSMGDLNDLARMGYVLENYDDVEVVTYMSGEADLSKEFRTKDNRPAPMLRFSKRVDGTYYVVEAIPESAHKKFWVVSAYMEKADGGTQAPDANGPRNTPDASLASSPSASGPMINQAIPKVKDQSLPTTGESSLVDDETAGKLLQNPDALRSLKKRGGLKLAKDMTQAEKRAAVKEAVKRAAGGQKTASGEGDGETHYSLKAFADGKRFVDVDTDQAQFDGLTFEQLGYQARKVIKEKFKGKVIGIENRVFVNGGTAEEYGHPVKKLSPQEQEAKMRASAELDNLLDAGTNFRTDKDGRDGHIHPEAAGDFQYFDTIFKVGDEYYSGVINIKPVARGLLLKDITDIRNITQETRDSYGENPQVRFLRDASMSSISQNAEKGNREVSTTASQTSETGQPQDIHPLTEADRSRFATEAGSERGLILDDYVQKRLRPETAELVNTVAKALGVRVRFVNSIRSGTANASIRGDEIRIERYNPNPVLYLLGHELTHRIQELAPKEYSRFKEAVQADVEQEAQALHNLYQSRGVKMDFAGALDEATANYAGRLIQNGRVLDEFIEKHRADRSILERVLDAIRGMLGKLTGQEKKNAQSAEEKLAAALDQAAKKAGKKSTATKGGEAPHFSLKQIQNLTENDVWELLENAANGMYADNSYIPLRKNTPPILISEVARYTKGETVVEDLPVVINVKKARQAMEPDNGDDGPRPHGIDAGCMIEIVRNMDKPTYIVLQENGRYVEVVPFFNGQSRKAWAVLDFGEFHHAPYMNGYEGGSFHVLVTVFGPDDLQSYLSANGNIIIYSAKTKGTP